MNRRQSRDPYTMEKLALDSIVVVGVFFLILITGFAYSQDVKYCKDLTTGEIVVVEAGMPCPFPMTEI